MTKDPLGIASKSRSFKAILVILLVGVFLIMGSQLKERWRLSTLSPQELVDEADTLLLEASGSNGQPQGRGKAIRLYLRAAEKASREDGGLAVRKYSFEALTSRIDHPLLVDALVDTLAHQQAVMRSSAAEALGRLGDRDASQGLILALQDDNAVVRRAATDALRAIHVRHPNMMINSYGRDPEIVREFASHALTRVDAPELSEATVLALGSPDAGVRKTAFVVVDVAIDDMGSHFGLQLGQVRAALGRGRTDSDRSIRQIAARVLTRFDDPSSVPDRLAALEQETDPSVRAELDRSLTSERSSAGTKRLLAALNSKELPVRVAAAKALAQDPDPAIVPQLVKYLVVRLGERRDWVEVRDSKTRVVRRVPRLEQDLQWVMRAVEKTGEPGEAHARELLVGWLLGPGAVSEDVAPELPIVRSPRDRRAAALALQSLGDKTTAPALIAALDDEDLGVQANVALALGILESESALGSLVALYSQNHNAPDPAKLHLADAVYAALVDITGAEFGRDPERWQDWWQRNREFFRQ